MKNIAKHSVFLPLILLLSFASFGQNAKGLFITVSLRGFNPIVIDHNPLGKENNVEILDGELVIAPHFGVGYRLPINDQSYLTARYLYGRIPQKIRINLPGDKYTLPAGFQNINETYRTKTIRSNELRVEYNRKVKSSNLNWSLGCSINAVKTFKSVVSVKFADILTDSLILYYRSEMIDNPNYQSERNANSKFYKFHLGIHGGVGYTFSKPISRVSFNVNYMHEDIGFGAFEFYNIGAVSEGWFDVRGSSLSVDYSYNLSNLKRENKKKK